MKTILEKYKIPLIRGGILLGIVILLFMVSFGNLKQNTDRNKTELEVNSGAGIIKNAQTPKSGQAGKDNQVEKNKQVGEDKTVEIHEKNKNTDKKDGDIDNLKDSANKKDKNTYALKDKKNTKIKKEAAPVQTKGISANPSTNTTGESHTVRKGDTLFSIAQRFGLSVDHLKELNGLYSDTIYENQVLKVRGTANNSASLANITGGSYTVRKGDTLSSIAQRAGVSVDHLKQLNGLYSDTIYANQVLKTGGTVANSSYQTVSRGSARSDDLYWLSRIIHSEAGGEPYSGKVAVGNVIINRVNSPLFPNTVKDVVFDRQNGHVQFSPVLDGSIYNTPGAESVRAAGESLAGSRPVGNALYFLNPRDSTNFWIVNNRKYMTTIGLHDFYY
ncbi:MAG: LysM peptidoglycan-binding domain-containing protein [Candidatus Alkaliphilus sp. MAG34]